MATKIYPHIVKPVLDYFFAILLLVILLPFLLFISLTILAVDGWPVIFIQERIGQEKKKFFIYKFKTMKNSKGPLLTFDSDPRVTKLGAYLRKYKIDELVQLINVVSGNMSFIGPRPEAATIARKHYKINPTIFQVKPGITGSSSVAFFEEYKLMPKNKEKVYDVYFKSILPKKIALDVQYVDNISLLIDIRIITRTLVMLIKSVFAV